MLPKPVARVPELLHTKAYAMATFSLCGTFRGDDGRPL